MAYVQRKISFAGAPDTNPETKPFWDAAREGRFLVPFCAACGKAHWYPRAICPFCAGDKVEWREASGKGTIYTFSVMRRVKEPYAIAHVTLAEGPTMLTNLVDCDFKTLKIGQDVKVTFIKAENEGPSLPFFSPA